MESKRLSKTLAAAGVASRRHCEELIFQGRVQVNGEVVRIPQTAVNLATDDIRVDGSQVKGEQKKVYYVLNKPRGVLCTNVRPGKKPIVLDLFPNSNERLFTVGRLDQESEGLLIVTNDGHFAQKIIHPSAGVIKEYLVKVAQEITPEHLEMLSEGARVDNRWVRPVSVRKVRRGTFRVCVKEGRKHEVRIITERAKLDLIELCRIRIGPLVLGNLASGEYRTLTQDEIRMLLSQKTRKAQPSRR